jgi:hypothetical protein
MSNVDERQSRLGRTTLKRTLSIQYQQRVHSILELETLEFICSNVCMYVCMHI